MKLSADDMAVYIREQLSKYADTVTDDVRKAVKKTGRAARQELTSTSPKNTGKYAKGWTVTTLTDNAAGASVVVRNKTAYQLTHLLENGHANRGGGRTRAFPHIAPAQENAEKMLEEELEKVLKG